MGLAREYLESHDPSLTWDSASQTPQKHVLYTYHALIQ